MNKHKHRPMDLHAAYHVPHGSADAEWRVLNGRLAIAIILEEGEEGEHFARLFEAAPQMLTALEQAERELTKLGSPRSALTTIQSALAWSRKKPGKEP